MSENRGSNLLTGILIGAALGAGVTFLFGTKKGKEIRMKVRDSYPEFFDHLDEILAGLKSTLGDRYGEVASEVEKIRTAAEETVNEKGEAAKGVVLEKIGAIGKDMEDLGTKIQKMDSDGSSKSKRFFKRKF